MEDLSMFQRPRTVALEYEKPGIYGTIRESRINLIATPRAGALITQVPPPVTNTLSTQPPQNPKSNINALQHKKKKKKKWRDVGDNEKRSYNLWYDLIAQLADSGDEEEESEVESNEEYSDESGENKVGREAENEDDSDGDDDDESEGEEENEDWLYDLLVELYDAQEREKENGDSQSVKESDVEDEIEDVEADD
ncbi:hypothetical protein PIB30_068369 [Stylosanthes scabra]|uniref:Uncharacterized protein n=1 Tax=Stylosanthes scabra TaxID=79078 RepID=A0ABU6YNF0_9FABA|nr:hypothetical protein [Stylosanthes scabra]